MLQTEFNKRHLYFLAGLVYFAYVFTMHKWGHQGDMSFWKDWSVYMFEHGLTNSYDNPGCNYLPAYLYIIWLHVKIQGNLTDIQDNLYTLKYYTFIFDVVGALLAAGVVRDMQRRFFYFLLIMFNVAYIYNTAYWGQVDAIFSCWGFAALILALERKPVWSILSLLIAFNFKLQSLVFVPVVGLVLLPQFFQKEAWKVLLKSILLAVCMQGVLLLPFLLEGKLSEINRIIFSSVGYYPHPAVGASNIWFLLLPGVSIDGMYAIIDTAPFLGPVSYKATGLVLFFSAVVLSVFPLLKKTFSHLTGKSTLNVCWQEVFLCNALVALSFYFFNTQMHERYAHPALLSLAAYTFLSGRYWPLILVSVAYFLNLERICWYLHLHQDTYLSGWIFKPQVIAGIYLTAIILLWKQLYVNSTQKEVSQ